MPSHDFNRPCDCRECRTLTFMIVCPQCNFENVVEVERTSRPAVDRKGIAYYDFEEPNRAGAALDCFACGAVVPNTRYFDRLDVDRCQYQLDRRAAVNRGELCSRCGRVKGFDWITAEGGLIDRLYQVAGEQLCKACFADHLEHTTPNPSDEWHRFTFNRRKLQWQLVKVKKACSVCGRLRWLNVENQWKDKCSNCYRLSLKSARGR